MRKLFSLSDQLNGAAHLNCLFENVKGYNLKSIRIVFLRNSEKTITKATIYPDGFTACKKISGKIAEIPMC